MLRTWTTWKSTSAESGETHGGPSGHNFCTSARVHMSAAAPRSGRARQSRGRAGVAPAGGAPPPPALADPCPLPRLPTPRWEAAQLPNTVVCKERPSAAGPAPARTAPAAGEGQHRVPRGSLALDVQPPPEPETCPPACLPEKAWLDAFLASFSSLREELQRCGAMESPCREGCVRCASRAWPAPPAGGPWAPGAGRVACTGPCLHGWEVTGWPDSKFMPQGGGRGRRLATPGPRRRPAPGVGIQQHTRAGGSVRCQPPQRLTATPGPRGGRGLQGPDPPSRRRTVCPGCTVRAAGLALDWLQGRSSCCFVVVVVVVVVGEECVCG